MMPGRSPSDQKAGPYTSAWLIAMGSSGFGISAGRASTTAGTVCVVAPGGGAERALAPACIFVADAASSGSSSGIFSSSSSAAACCGGGGAAASAACPTSPLAAFKDLRSCLPRWIAWIFMAAASSSWRCFFCSAASAVSSTTTLKRSWTAAQPDGGSVRKSAAIGFVTTDGVSSTTTLKRSCTAAQPDGGSVRKSAAMGFVTTAGVSFFASSCTGGASCRFATTTARSFFSRYRACILVAASAVSASFGISS
mmetsp:Transcript_84746/g.273959  ORF Transcript_84746/g.273959 Transcript_84746/m.273959 type:complete len:253 (-) Transcript_84746:691-1449(-)